MSNEAAELLAACDGFSVEADDGDAGAVEMTLFPPDGEIPDFLVLRVRSLIATRRPVVSVALVEAVDTQRRIVRVRGKRGQVIGLPEHLPLAI
jgi:hypothetical protein